MHSAHEPCQCVTKVCARLRRRLFGAARVARATARYNECTTIVAQPLAERWPTDAAPERSGRKLIKSILRLQCAAGAPNTWAVQQSRPSCIRDDDDDDESGARTPSGVLV